MSRKFEINEGIFDEDVIAFCRKLKNSPRNEDGSKSYVVQFKRDYSLDGKGRVNYMFLNEEQGIRLMELLQEVAIKL